MDERFQDCWFLTGPTASGKTLVGLELADRLNAEIISLDSMAIYRHMNVGTAKPTPEQTQRIPHHLIDIIEPNQNFSVANYVDEAAACVEQLQRAGKQVLFVGGTPLYLKALLRGMFDGPPADWDFRNEIEREIAEVGLEALHERLRQVDPLSANKLPQGDVRRIVRALEVYKLTGKPISHWQMQFDQGRPAEVCRVFVLDWPRTALHARIEQRVEVMFENGLVDEVRDLRQRYSELSRTAMQAVGYREVVDWLDKGADESVLPQTIERVKTRTRRFAKRQCTWFRSLSECRTVPRSDGDEVGEFVEQIASLEQTLD